MFPWDYPELILFAVGFVSLIFAFDYGHEKIRMNNLMADIEQYFYYIELDKKEENDGN